MRTNYINRLVGRITASSQSNNDTFTFYGHRIDLQSGTPDYVDVTFYRNTDQYSGEIATFSFDFLVKVLYIEYAEVATTARTYNDDLAILVIIVEVVEQLFLTTVNVNIILKHM